MATSVTSAPKGDQYNRIARVLVLDSPTNAALEKFLRRTLANETYLEGVLSTGEIHMLKRLGETVLKGEDLVHEPLQEWEESLLAGGTEEPLSYAS